MLSCSTALLEFVGCSKIPFNSPDDVLRWVCASPASEHEGSFHEHGGRACSSTGSGCPTEVRNPELPDAPTPDLLDHERITAYLKPVHDVGGEPDAPMRYENKQYELWEHTTYVICEVLAWRGIWLSEERRRIGNVDVGRTEYLGLPYYGRWLLAVARVLVEKHHIGLTELSERMAEVKGRYQGGLAGKKLAAKPKSEGDGSQVKRNEHHKRAVGKGDPQVYAGQAGQPKFKISDAVVVRELPVIFYIEPLSQTRVIFQDPSETTPTVRPKFWANVGGAFAQFRHVTAGTKQVQVESTPTAVDRNLWSAQREEPQHP
jgi:hypothetical protein